MNKHKNKNELVTLKCWSQEMPMYQMCISDTPRNFPKRSETERQTVNLKTIIHQVLITFLSLKYVKQK